MMLLRYDSNVVAWEYILLLQNTHMNNTMSVIKHDCKSVEFSLQNKEKIKVVLIIGSGARKWSSFCRIKKGIKL